jgi:acetamidase/formamidase
MKHHHLKASAETCHRGFFDAARKPVLRINSGDRVTIDTLSGAPEFVPKSGFHVPPELAEVHARAERFAGGPHILTGPIAIRGAKPGHVLEVRIIDVKLR